MTTEYCKINLLLFPAGPLPCLFLMGKPNSIPGLAELCRQPAGCLATPIPGPAELGRQPGCLATPIPGLAELCRQPGCLATTTCMLGQAELLCSRPCGTGLSRQGRTWNFATATSRPKTFLVIMFVTFYTLKRTCTRHYETSLGLHVHFLRV